MCFCWALKWNKNVSGKKMPNRHKNQKPVRILPFSLSDGVQLCIADPERDYYTESVGFEHLLPISSRECLAWALSSHLLWGKEWKVVFFFFFNAFLLRELLNLRSLLTGTNIFHKRVPFPQVGIFAYKQIDCGKIPTKLYSGAFQKKNHARENYRNGIYKGIHMLSSIELKHSDMAISRTKTWRHLTFHFFEQQKSLIQENQSEINKQQNSVPFITSYNLFSL